MASESTFTVARPHSHAHIVTPQQLDQGRTGTTFKTCTQTSYANARVERKGGMVQKLAMADAPNLFAVFFCSQDLSFEIPHAFSTVLWENIF